MATKNITEHDFKETIEDNDIVILDFWASWCGPCRAFAPTFERVSEKHPDIVFGKVNTEEQRALAAGFGIQGIPTLMVFREGIMLLNQAGALPASALERLVQQVRDLDMEEVRAKATPAE